MRATLAAGAAKAAPARARTVIVESILRWRMNQERTERLEVGWREKHRGTTCPSYNPPAEVEICIQDRIVRKNGSPHRGTFPPRMAFRSRRRSLWRRPRFVSVNSILIGICLGSIDRLAGCLDLSEKVASCSMFTRASLPEHVKCGKRIIMCVRSTVWTKHTHVRGSAIKMG